MRKKNDFFKKRESIGDSYLQRQARTPREVAAMRRKPHGVACLIRGRMAKAKDAQTQSNAAPEKSKGGRPSSYLPEYNDVAFRLALLGATDGDMADTLGVNEATINRWKKDHPEFCESLKKGKRIADTVIANALYERAKGAEWVEEVGIKCKDVTWEDGKKVEREHVEVVELRKAAPPDTTACIFWLKNRDPKNWRDKQEVETTLHSPTPLTLILGGEKPEAKA